MHEIQLSTVDLNLLVVVHALLEERNVTRAARRLGRTPSATSHALARSRALFEDPLLVREGRGMVLTPRAQQLLPVLERTLTEAKRALSAGEGFDPATSRRTFRLACPDLLCPVLPDLLKVVSRRGPYLGVEIVPPLSDPARGLADGLADLQVGRVPDDAAGLKTRTAGKLHWGVLARAGHPLGERLTLAKYLTYPHVMVRTGSVGPSMVQAALSSEDVPRRIGIVVPNFLLGAFVVASTDLLFTGPREVLRRVASRLKLKVHKAPMALPPLRAALSWSERFDNDDGLRWFRTVVFDAIQAQLVKSRGL